MLYGECRRFLRDEQGGGTVLGLIWFMLLVGITGLAVDTTDGFRIRTMLQATADSAALAGAIDLPDTSAAIATAISYSVDNMGVNVNGHVLEQSDVHIGQWDPATQSLDTSSPTPDAVMVFASRSTDKGNALPVNFLRMIGVEVWNVNTQAVAQRFIPACLRDGLIARGIVDISSNNGFANDICVHGEQGVEMQNNNVYESGVNVSMPNLEMLVIPSSGMASNTGLQDALRENYLDPRMVNHIDEIIAKLEDPSLDTDLVTVIPSYIDTSLAVIVEDEKFKFIGLIFAPGSGRIYHIQCNSNKTANIPGNTTYSNVVIVADCKLGIGSGAVFTNVVLASSALANGANPVEGVNINFAAGVQLGVSDNCTPGGGVQIFSAASVKTSSSTQINGVQIVAAGNIDLGAQAAGINGISAQAGLDIDMTSNNAFGLCSGGTPDLFTVPYYRLVL